MFLKKVHRVVNVNQNAWLKPYINANIDLRKKEKKNDFVKDFLKLMNNSAFAKTMENVRKRRDSTRVTKGRKINYLVPEPNYHTYYVFHRKSIRTF